MAEKISFDLVSPERLLLSDTADMVTIPATEGYMGVMAGHAPVVTTLRPGMIDVLKDGADQRYFIRGGFAEISAAKVTKPVNTAPTVMTMERVKASEIRVHKGDVARSARDASGSNRPRARSTLNRIRAATAA